MYIKKITDSYFVQVFCLFFIVYYQPEKLAAGFNV